MGENAVMINQLIAALEPSPTLDMARRCRVLAAQGHNVVNLSVGEPDLPIPDWIKEAAIRAVHEGHHRYSAVGGMPAFKEAIRRKLERENGLKGYEADQIIVGCGAKHVLFNALFVSLEEGDEVIIPAPYWVSYSAMVVLGRGKPVCVPCPQANGFKLTPELLEKAITPRTKWLMINSPSNPSGATYSFEELQALGEVLRKYPHVWVLSDEIYEHLVYEGPTPCPQIGNTSEHLRDRLFIVNGVSKTFSMAGWRIGYGVGPKSLVAAIDDFQSQSVSHACLIAQVAATTALNEAGEDFFAERRRIFKERRDFFTQALKETPGFQVAFPEGAFYVFADCQGMLNKHLPEHNAPFGTDSRLADALLDHALVSCVPGSAFGMDGYLRFSYATDMQSLQTAAERINHFAYSLKG